jgi:fido (protein-threonine AMPylation protein)
LQDYDASPWIFGFGAETQLLAKIKGCSSALSDIADHIIVGLQTSADSVYILQMANENKGTILCHSQALDRTIEFEKQILRPLISGTNIDRYECLLPVAMLLFPYSLKETDAELLSEELFEKKFPLSWQYLKENESQLRSRENNKFDDKSWYRFGRHQNLNKQWYPKLAVPRLIDRLKAIYDKAGEYYLDNVDVNGILLKDDSPYKPEYILSLLNSRLMDFLFKKGSVKFRGEYYSANKQFLAPLPIATISFTTPAKVRKERVAEAIERYKRFMLDLDSRGNEHENKDNSTKQRRALADDTLGCGEEAVISGEHSGTGKRVHGVRGRARKPEDAQRVSEESAEYASTTRYLESSLGIKSYAELAPFLAQGVERVMASLLDREPAAIKITPEFICGLHKDAFRELFPSWAGCYRDREVTVGKHKPPPYFEVPILMRQYCDDLESRLVSVGEKPEVTDVLLETLAFAEGRFLSIHPFLDFNGRVARMLLFALLYRLDLPPIPLIPDENDQAGRKEYFNVLSAGDEFNWLPLVEVWKRRLGIGGKA